LEPAKTEQRILNGTALASHGNIDLRTAMVQILEAGMQASDPYENTTRLMRLCGDQLHVGGLDFLPHGAPFPEEGVFDLSKAEHIFVLGAGKGIQ
jgi:hypothetical protein